MNLRSRRGAWASAYPRAGGELDRYFTTETRSAGLVRGVKELKFGENGNLAEFPKNTQALASHAVDFDPPLYNIWKQQEKTAGIAPALLRSPLFAGMSAEDRADA